MLITGLGPGTHLVRVQSRVPSNLKVQGITPSQIQVRLLEYAQRRLPVKVEVPTAQQRKPQQTLNGFSSGCS